jgi:hypoxanthine phosphoribosyltransferase
MSDVNFIIIEDIVDSGKTLSHLVRYLKERGAASVKTCTLLDKPSRRVVDFVPDYCGMEIPDKFVVGFGLDYDEKYRNLPFVGVLKPEVYTKQDA